MYVLMNIPYDDLYDYGVFFMSKYVAYEKYEDAEKVLEKNGHSLDFGDTYSNKWGDSVEIIQLDVV